MLSTMKPRRAGGGNSGVESNRGKTMEEKYSIKNLIFMPSKPSYVIPVDVQGHKVFLCVDCGDRFVCESSYNYHVNRRSIKITYTCRSCSQTNVYMNRCNLLSHIRSHVFTTATINLIDLKIEPLAVEDMLFGLFHLNEPLTMDQVLLNEQLRKEKNNLTQNTESVEKESTPSETVVCNVGDDSLPNKPCRKRAKRRFKCLDCDAVITYQENLAKYRAQHYMAPQIGDFKCGICDYEAPSYCAIKAHIRMHTMLGQNCICPECGVFVHSRHSCLGFRRMKMFSFTQCPIIKCGVIVQAMKIRSHFIEKHIRPVYKCSLCDTACLTKSSVQSHLTSKHLNLCSDVMEVSLYYQCVLCPGRLVLKQCLSSHIDTHKRLMKLVYPCKFCDFVGKNVPQLLGHNLIHDITNNEMADIYGVKLSCKNCKMSTKVSKMSELPKNCPHCNSTSVFTRMGMEDKNYKNTNDISRIEKIIETDSSLKCPLCRKAIGSDWDIVKLHFSAYHKKHSCIDIKLELQRIEDTKTIALPAPGPKKRKRNKVESKSKKRYKNSIVAIPKENFIKTPLVDEVSSKYTCKKCGEITSNNETSFKNHILTHRDPSTAYQCMECGCCFVVKPSFSTHLFVAHGISDADSYIESNECFNEDAFKSDIKEPLKENQCKICLEVFDCSEDLDKHFRVHGMAFLMTKRVKKDAATTP